MAEKFTVMEFVPAPVAIVAPVGRVHTYDVALTIGETEYATPLWPWHTGVIPVIGPAGPGSKVTVTG
jgi:hypothetical protein